MKVSVKDAGTCRKTMSIEIPANVIGEERAETLKVYAKHFETGRSTAPHDLQATSRQGEGVE